MRVKAPTARSGKRPARRPKVVDEAFIEALALRYLDRFDATVAKLRSHLLRAAEQEVARGAEAPPADAVLGWIEALLSRYQASGVLSDRRYAESLLGRLRGRGASAQGIVHKLRAHGVESAVVGELAQAPVLDKAHELEAARQLVKRRKLGPFRTGPQDPTLRRADLARLARAGFDFAVAREALQASAEDDEEEFAPSPSDAFDS
jgi:regulatory protein